MKRKYSAASGHIDSKCLAWTANSFLLSLLATKCDQIHSAYICSGNCIVSWVVGVLYGIRELFT